MIYGTFGARHLSSACVPGTPLEDVGIPLLALRACKQRGSREATRCHAEVAGVFPMLSRFPDAVGDGLIPADSNSMPVCGAPFPVVSALLAAGCLLPALRS